jgi:branched-chain amino acid transport system ATP-binding protein
MMNTFFEMRHVTKEFGGLTAVMDFSLVIDPGEVVGLIGPNGAGKTTVFNLASGFLPPTAGDVIWNGENINHFPAHLITARGLARTFQNIKLFGDMTVLENVMVSFHYSIRSNFLEAMLGLPKYRHEENQIREKSLQYLEELGLLHLFSEKAANLPYGQQRKLEIARALATHPMLLLLDEPAAGMNPIETMELAELIRKIRDKYEISVFLIEHDMKFVMGLCDRIKVLEYGHSIAEGVPSEIQRNPAVIKAYLGSGSYAQG